MMWSLLFGGNNKRSQNDDPPGPPSSQQEKKNEKKKKKKQHSLYGTMITIESPTTTPKVSHVTTKQFVKQRLQQDHHHYYPPQNKQQHKQQQTLHQSNSMPDMDGMVDNYDINDNHQHDPLTQPLFFQQHKKGDDYDGLEKDDDDNDDNNSLSSASYSDIRPSLVSADNNKLSMRSTSTFGSVRSIITQSVGSVVDATFRLPGKPSSIRDAGGTASISNEVFNLIKNIVGAGAFGLPRGVAAFANAPSALYPAAFCTIAMGAIFGYYFLLMGRICSLTSTASYREAWDETAGIRSSSLDGSSNHCSGIMGAIVPLFIVFMAGLGNLAYNMILADTCKSLLGHVGVHVSRTQCLIGTTVCVLLPLCMVKRLSRLAPFSVVGLIGIVFTIGAVVWRYYDGSYQAEEGMMIWQNTNEDQQATSVNNMTGFVLQQQDPHHNNNTTSDSSYYSFWSQVRPEMQPLFGTVGAIGAFSGNFLILACMCFQSYFCHYNAPRYYIELKNNTIQRFTLVTVISFTVCIVLYIVIMTYGFLTFGEHSDGFLLNNYADEDTLITLCRFLIAVALAFTYPLPFIGVRDGLLDLLMVPADKRTSNNLNVLTLILLAIFCGLAMQFTDVGIVNAVGGGIGGAAVVFVFPALMFRHVVYDLGIHARRSLRLEAKFAIVLMWLGIAMGGIGAYMGIQAA